MPDEPMTKMMLPTFGIQLDKPDAKNLDWRVCCTKLFFLCCVLDKLKLEVSRTALRS